jgi:hypothetical protein
LRDEGPDVLARETGQAAATISAWREDFLAAGHEGLKPRPAPVEDRRLAEAQRKIGKLAMDNDILRGLTEEMDRRPRSPRRLRGIWTSRKRVLRLCSRTEPGFEASAEPGLAHS